MISFPRAKINLGLRVLEKRPDGFHEIETIFYPIALSDALEFVVSSGKAAGDELVITGINIKTRPEKNLVTRAVKRLRTGYPVPPLKIHLHKAIPAGAGLGGGSSDAACMIRSMTKCFRFSITDDELKAIALELGSDCPFFLNPVPSIGTGRGEILKPINPALEGFYIMLLNPGFLISTKEAYHNCIPARREADLEELVAHPLSAWKKLIVNDFEDFVFKVYPMVGDLKRALYKAGAVYCSMTGSGSTVYGIFAEKPEISGKLKDYLIYEGIL
ncbi:MAG: 4-(cytidine 5'-diphospho)-2-C-methyl-D-erythritol kinase [Bacteroidetes bacterium RBG_13_43_22]|nr:MAG: 4-(cytidine 5'-diphospho)-2-C-methyl-D-erythritol kinase [Bacteroidetes bacterium RBG_13_43_22]